MIKQLVGLLAVLAVAALFVALLPLMAPTELGPVTRHYVEQGLVENRGANLVTSIVVNYRGFDTLGEVTVLFLSVSGAGFVLRRREGLVPEPQRRSSELVQTASRVLFAPIVLFGAYIFVHGHLTPGGGFQGGAVIASAVLLLLLADRDRLLPHGFLSVIESFSGFGYVVTGFVGLAATGSFLANRGVIDLGTWNRLFSAGVIPVIYVLIGLKVGSELATLLDTMMHADQAGEGH